MKVLVIKAKTLMTTADRLNMEMSISRQLEVNGFLVLDDHVDYEVVDIDIVKLKEE